MFPLLRSISWCFCLLSVGFNFKIVVIYNLKYKLYDSISKLVHRAYARVKKLVLKQREYNLQGASNFTFFHIYHLLILLIYFEI
jgi:hypothetical protein